ncbi:MAG TPA: TonB-dependent receptor plug domain-containing protein, partial [Burkholderiales bacterium]|nr:TonB-dependent receptor plug domain-containing protein [Burkholderiales bacterium]
MVARARWRRALVFSVLFLASAAVGAQTMRVADIADLSIEELGNIQVTSVSRHAERLSDAAASVFVITGEDIRRSGATRLAEALRLAPNLEVARSSASSYAISARGFNNTIANKLLVLIDGRTVYTPLFSGVFWDAQDVMLEDVERIEVISGPGATLWGANAVNGVINVITRRASDTQGAFAYGHAGDLERGYGARYGGAMGAAGSYRVYGRFFDVFNTSNASGATASD